MTGLGRVQRTQHAFGAGPAFPGEAQPFVGGWPGKETSPARRSMALQRRPVACLLLLLGAGVLQELHAQSKPYSPPCTDGNLCNTPRTCYVCTNAEYSVAPNGFGGYPASAQCSAVVENCLYCWKQVDTVTTADGWSSKYQFKSCVPWALEDSCTGNEKTCKGQYALYKLDYCQTQQLEKTVEACAKGGWCTKTTTECACSSDKCNPASRVRLHHFATSIFMSGFLGLLLRKCVA